MGMIQRLEIQEYDQSQKLPTAKVFANIDHVGCIMGHGGMRIKEIRRLSGASVTIVDPTGDRCLREITIAPNPKAPNSGMQSIPFAIWLMNVAINAFADVSASLCPFGLETSLRDVVTTGAYGQPDMGQNQEYAQQQQEQGQEDHSGFQQAPEMAQNFQPPAVENSEVKQEQQQEEVVAENKENQGENEEEVKEENKDEENEEKVVAKTENNE